MNRYQLKQPRLRQALLSAAAYVVVSAVISATPLILNSSAARAETPLEKVQVQATRALFEAIQQNSITAVRTQIALGADLDARNADGQTPVGLAVSLRYTTIAELLSRSRVMQRAAEESAVPLRAPTVKVLRAGQSRTGNAPPVRETKVVTDENGVAIYESAREEQIRKPAQPNTAFPSTLVWPPAPDFVVSVDGRRVPTDPSANVFSFDSPPDRVTAAPVSSVTTEPVAPAPARIAPPEPAAETRTSSSPVSSAEPVRPASADKAPGDRSAVETGLSTQPDSNAPATPTEEPVTALQEKPDNGDVQPEAKTEPSILERIGKLFSEAAPTDPPATSNSLTADAAPEPPTTIPAVEAEPAPLRIAEPVDATTGLDPVRLAEALSEPVQPAPPAVAKTELAVAETAPVISPADGTTTPVHASPADFIAALGEMLTPEPTAGFSPEPETASVEPQAEKPLPAAKPEPEVLVPPEVLDRPLAVQPVIPAAPAAASPDPVPPQLALSDPALSPTVTDTPAAEQKGDLLDVIADLFRTEASQPVETPATIPATNEPAVALTGETTVVPASPVETAEPPLTRPSVVDAVEFTPESPQVLAQAETVPVSAPPVAAPVAVAEPVVTNAEIPEPDFFNRVASLFSFGNNKGEAPKAGTKAKPETLASIDGIEQAVGAADKPASPETTPAPRSAYFPGEKKIVSGAWPPAPTEPTAPPPPMPRRMIPEASGEEVVQTASLEVGPAPSRELPLPVWTTAAAVDPRTFAFSELMHLGHHRDLYDAKDTKCLKYVYRHKKERIRACVVNVKWPREIRPDFVSNSIIYTGQKAIVVYQDGIAAAMYALFRSDAYDRISTYLAGQYGPTTEYSRDKVQLMAGGRRENEISLWRGTDPASGLEMEMEVRKFDDVRDLFGDPYHGMIEIRFAESRRVFQFVQPLDLMTNR
tara:strand:- start:1610 stop:4405 length:2796 start_codon:yes stop_codon:yes gene_type:complete